MSLSTRCTISIRRLTAVCIAAALASAVLRTHAYGAERSEEPSLELITQEEMDLLLAARKPRGPPPMGLRPIKPFDISRLSAQDLAIAFRAAAAIGAVAARIPGKYELVPPTLSKAARRALAESIARREAQSNDDVQFAIDPLSIYQVRSPALERLFPEHAFVVVPFAVAKKPDSRDALPHWGVYYTAALPKNAGKVYEFNEAGSHEAFGDFLHDMRISIRNERDAALVWDALCATHKKRPSPGKHVRASPGVWRLNESVFGSVAPGEYKFNEEALSLPGIRLSENWYEVHTDTAGRVLRGKVVLRERK